MSTPLYIHRGPKTVAPSFSRCQETQCLCSKTTSRWDILLKLCIWPSYQPVKSFEPHWWRTFKWTTIFPTELHFQAKPAFFGCKVHRCEHHSHQRVEHWPRCVETTRKSQKWIISAHGKELREQSMINDKHLKFPPETIICRVHRKFISDFCTLFLHTLASVLHVDGHDTRLWNAVRSRNLLVIDEDRKLLTGQ